MSLVTLEEAQTYFDSKINAQAWEAQPALQQKALNQAHLIVNSLRYFGTPDTLTNQFPRDGGTVPVAIQNAICECAYALLDGVDPEMEMQTISLQKQTIASASTTFDHTNDADRIMAGVPSATAWRLLLPYLSPATAVSLKRV